MLLVLKPKADPVGTVPTVFLCSREISRISHFKYLTYRKRRKGPYRRMLNIGPYICSCTIFVLQDRADVFRLEGFGDPVQSQEHEAVDLIYDAADVHERG